MFDPNAAKEQINARARQRGGRDLSEQEFGILGGAVGYSGGAVDQGALDKALGYVDSYFGGASAGAAPKKAPSGGGGTAGAQQGQAAPQAAPGAANSPVTPTGQISPAYSGSQVGDQRPGAGQQIDPGGVAIPIQVASRPTGMAIPMGGSGNPEADVRGYFKNKHGRDFTGQEWQMLLDAVGYRPGMAPSQDMIQRAYSLIDGYQAPGGGAGAPGGEENPPPGPIGNPRWTPGDFEAFPTQRVEFGEALDRYKNVFGGGNQPFDFTNFNGPDQEIFDQQINSALSNALGNSEFSPEKLAMMKEVQKEQALQVERDLQQQMADQYAGMGRAGSGAAQAAQNRLAIDTRSGILDAYRDIELGGAQGRRQELIGTASALGDALNSQMARATQGYGSTLQGETLQADENFRTKFQPADLALRAALGEAATDMDYNNLDWQKEQFAQLFPEDQRQYNIDTVLNFMKFMEGQREFNEGLGLDWTKFNWDSIFGGGGRF